MPPLLAWHRTLRSPRRNSDVTTQLTAGPALTPGWLDRCSLVKSLDEGELAYSSGVLVEEVAELLRDLAVDAHAVVEGVVPEQRVPCRNDMPVVLDEPLLPDVGLVDLASRWSSSQSPPQEAQWPYRWR